MKKIITILIVLTSMSQLNAQVAKFGFKNLLAEKPNQIMPFAIAYEGEKTLKVLENSKIIPTSVCREWIYVNTTPSKIEELNQNLLIKDFYFEVSRPQLLTDTSRVKHHVEEIHTGTGISMPFTGKNVIMGIVDDGIDFRHPDFLDVNGKTRVLYFWDHKLDSVGNPHVPSPYGYGLEYDSSYINLQIATYQGPSPQYPTLGGQDLHGTIVTGIAAGNGFADGSNKGLAPDSKIIFVRSNFGLSNWSLSVADAVEYIFKKADDLGLPCVVNLSLGDYLGSHDGNDPASIKIENLLNAKPGRIVVAAAGNSGNIGKYHVHGLVATDTSFTWLLNNSNNFIYFDLWAAQADMQNVRYSFGANLPSGTFESRAKTNFRNTSTSLGGVIFDTLRNSSGQRIATLEIYPSLVNGLFRLEGYFSNIDSASYYYRFSTTGTGQYDLWSGQGLGLNNFVTTPPSSAQFPKIIYYQAPDSLQSIVSGWACSEKVVTVANFVNRQSILNRDGNVVVTPVPSGMLSANSSKGPNRLNVIKPDIAATGDVTFGAAPLWYLSDANNYVKLDAGGWHKGDGGTSMASPCIAAIAALYLEKCNKATYADFLSDLKATGMSDFYTGTSLPNNGFGYGKANGLETLLRKSYAMNIQGLNLLCDTLNILTVSTATSLDSIVWGFQGNKTNNDTLIFSQIGTYEAISYSNPKLCKERDTITISQGQIVTAPTISLVGGVLTSSSASNYQWYNNGVLIAGQTFQTFIGSPTNNNHYQVATTSPDGCKAFSNVYQKNAELTEIENSFSIFPNPTNNELEITANFHINEISIEDLNGRVVFQTKNVSSKINISSLKRGVYILKLTSDKEILTSRIEKL